MKKVINTIKWNNKDFSTPLRYARNDKEHVSFRPERNEMERSGEILINGNNMKKVINTIKWNNKDFSTPLRYARNDIKIEL